MNKDKQYIHREKQISALLYYSGGRCAKDFLCDALECDDKTLSVCVANMEAQGIIRNNEYFPELIHLSLNKETVIFLKNQGKASSSNLWKMLHCAVTNDIEGMCRASTAYADELCCSGRYRYLKFFYDIVVRCFLWSRPCLTDVSTCRQYIDTSYHLLIFFESFPFVLTRSLTWYLKTRALAYAIKYSTPEYAFSASTGFLLGNNLKNVVKFFYSDYIFSNGHQLKNVSRQEETITFLPYLSMKYFMEGNFIKSINCIYDKYQELHTEPAYFSRLLYVFSACSAIYLGEYEICLNVLETGRKRAQSAGKKHDAATLQAVKAYAYVFQGEYEAARRIIDDALRDTGEHLATYAELWAVRALACLHYREGNLAESYRVYKKYLERPVDEGVVHAGYIVASMVLEVMTAWTLAGYEHPFGRDIRSELDGAKQSPSCMLRTIALRCETEVLAREQGWNHDRVRALLDECLRQARALSSPVQRAKTLLCAARSARAAGRTDEARHYMQEVADTCRRYGCPVIPADMANLLDDAGGLTALPPPGGPPRGRDVPPGRESGFIIHSDSMQELLNKVALLAPRDTSVLILGESGVGKEHIARQLHEQSGRRGKFVAVNLASVPNDLFESEFYGHEKGSFTGASYAKEGLLELADGGTLFLDEVGDMPSHMQVKLLRVLQEKNFMRVGGTTLRTSDFRVISATNINLENAVREGTFREDLYYRINVFSLYIPPLRSRQHDVIFIAEYFLDLFLKKYNVPVRRFSSDDLKFLTSYQWPGNVRELKNYIERYVFLSDSEHARERARAMKTLEEVPGRDAEAKPLSDLKPPPHGAEGPEGGAGEDDLFNALLDEQGRWRGGAAPTLEDIKRRYIEFAYATTKGVIAGPEGLAALLGVSKVSAYAWVEKLALKERFQLKMVRRKEGRSSTHVAREE